MKWKQRIILIFVTICACLAVSVFLVEKPVNKKSYRKDKLSVGDRKGLQMNMDIYPGKLRKRSYNFTRLHRELQGKSVSADQESPDHDDTQKDWLADLDSEQIKLLQYLINKIYPDETTFHKILKAIYLIVNETLSSNIDSHLQDLDIKPTDLDQVKHLLHSNGLLKHQSDASDHFVLKNTNEQQNVPKTPAKSHCAS